MKRKVRLTLLPIACVALCSFAFAATVNIDLSGGATGTLITAPGGIFAGTFVGQSVVAGTGISGSPSNPLTPLAANMLGVGLFDPGVSPAGNSILPEPGNQGPLSLLLASDADSLTWTMGFGNGGSIAVALFSGTGALLHSTTFSSLNGYNVYNLSGVGVFRAVTFFNDNDPGGLRFMNFSYNSSSVPEPAAISTGLAALSLLGAIAYRRRRRC